MALNALVNGYHTTSRARAELIKKNGFTPSKEEWDWLGEGVYFWQDAPLRAWEWSGVPRQEQRLGAQIVVIRATIQIPLNDSIDLLDIGWEQRLRELYDILRRGRERIGKPLPDQPQDFSTPRPHKLDCLVLNELARTLATERTAPRVVRAAFPEGTPIYPKSALLNRTHVQIAVRDVTLIKIEEFQSVRPS